METQAVAEQVAEWVVEVCDPEIQGSYTHLPFEKPQALPDVVCEVLDKGITRDDPRMPWSQLEQTWLRIWQVNVSVMVDNQDPEQASNALSGYSDQLEAALMQDGTLGGRVQLVSPYHRFDFSTPYVEYQDGMRGREMNLQISVGELVEAPE